ncbi:MAG: protein YgfX [Nitrosomonas sp.]|nr:protein YgfX [Nitrosomonas sp.]
MSDLHLQLHTSRQLTWLMLMAHGFAAVVFLPMTLNYPVVITVCAILLLTLSLVYYLQRYAWLLSAQSIVSLHLTARTTCQVRLLSNDCLDCAIDVGTTFVAPYLTVLSLKTNRIFRRRTVVILPDSVDPESFRQLRVWLRWK